MRQRLKHFYSSHVVPRLRAYYNYYNTHQVPKLLKIVVNRGLGRSVTKTERLEDSIEELTTITTQRRTVTRARKAVAGFKIRKRMPLGLSVTLRGRRIYAFLDRLINLTLPRIRDFRGLNPRSFDGQGNYSMGFREQTMFPEIRFDQIDQVIGLDFVIVTSPCTDEEGRVLLTELGIPFKLVSYLHFMSYILSKVLTSIRNALKVKKVGIVIQDTEETSSFSKILLNEGLISEIETIPYVLGKKALFLRLKYRGPKRTSIITSLRCVSRPSLQIYTKRKALPKVLNGLGIVVLSTSNGLMTDKNARKCSLGGKILCSIWLS